MRSLSEIQRIWAGLCQKPAVYVDHILNGSGSSRNQPETILANLPYIEWFRMDKRKHIAFIGKSTHTLGTLKQMDEVKAEKIRQSLRNDTVNAKTPTIIVVANDVRHVSQNLENVTVCSMQIFNLEETNND